MKSQRTGPHHDPVMPNRETRARLGHRQATEIALSLGRELRTTRRAAGLRQEDVGRSAGISHAQVSR
ncbi:MAG TPA: helix-turn-helix transcriptional regulator, partial [Candidatus Binatia bacterium]|nr:helix-turn-helix transcriptional regulator [Candidatus Binatia bacterium]